ncbi:MAG: hypothetical protein JNM30_14090 [Rhodospirillales bacterium]|nr:hypothetical protein [Rhodospirillales bacterium]
MSKEKGDYKVGYGKPPVEHQVKKGQILNPKGRPKGSTSAKAKLEKVLGKKIKINGESMTALEGAWTVQMAKALNKGDTKALELLISAGKYLEIIKPEPDPDKVELPRVLVVPERLPIDRWMEVYGKPMQEKTGEIPVSTEGPKLADYDPRLLRKR